MKNRDIIATDLSEAINVFAEKLPDPVRSYNSTIKDEVLLNDTKVTLLAQKRKGENGMCWEINYKPL
ncbi:hypothetical protein GZH53_04610 [Flavihumibacter sp. R14]|nr:hypothetical protein [Flavihumibacter soli]